MPFKGHCLFCERIESSEVFLPMDALGPLCAIFEDMRLKRRWRIVAQLDPQEVSIYQVRLLI